MKQEILSQMGAPMVRVEIDESAWGFIFKRAKRWFHSKKGVMGAAVVTAQSEMDYPPQAEIIIDVVLATDCGGSLGSIMTGGFFSDIVPADVIARGGMYSTSFSNYSAFVQLIQQIEQVRRTFSSEPDWYVDAVGRLHLMPGSVAGNVLVIYKKRPEFWEISELRDRDEDIFYRCALNEVKYVLSRVRGKYPSYPAAGGSIETDAAGLMEEWKEGREELNIEIDQMAMPIGMVAG